MEGRCGREDLTPPVRAEHCPSAFLCPLLVCGPCPFCVALEWRGCAHPRHIGLMRLPVGSNKNIFKIGSSSAVHRVFKVTTHNPIPTFNNYKQFALCLSKYLSMKMYI